MNDNNGSIPADLEKEAKNLYQAGKYQQAAKLFSEAAAFYEAGGRSSLAAEMKNNQSVSLLKCGQPELALEVVQGTSEVFRHADDPRKMAMALANEATAHKELGSTDLAIERFSQAAEIFQELGEDILLLQTSQSLSSLKLKSQDIPGALFSMQKGLEGIKKPNLRQRLLLNLLKIPNRLIWK